jgi:hypothetical protein
VLGILIAFCAHLLHTYSAPFHDVALARSVDISPLRQCTVDFAVE